MTLAISSDDLPADPPSFDFDRVASVLAADVLSQRSHAFVLGLHGPWGCGKSTLLGALRKKLDDDVLIIDFNAWKYADREALWRALILRVIEAVKGAGGDAKLADEMQRSLYSEFTVEGRGALKVDWVAATTEAVLMAMRLATANIAAGPISGAGTVLNRVFNRKPQENDGKLDDASKSIERIGGVLKREVTRRTVERVVSIEQFLANFRILVSSLGEKKRIAVLVDDLDRCLPETSLEIFEAIKLFMDAPECVYVIAVDRDAIARGLTVRYANKGSMPVDPDQYIEKTITLSIDVPMLTQQDGETLLKACITAAACTDAQITAAATVLGPSPRRLKRFARLLDVHAQLGGHTGSGGAIDDMALKLALINYLNSRVFARLQREPALGYRLHMAVNERTTAFNKQNPDFVAARKAFVTRLLNEDEAVQAAAGDERLWAAVALEPRFDADPAALVGGLQWFRTAPRNA